MIARKLLWIVEICWGTASNFHHLQSKTFNLFFLVFSFCLCSFFPANCCALNDPSKLIQICEGSSIFFPSLAMFIQDCTKKKLFNWIIEIIKLCDCLFNIFVMPPVHENFQMWSYHCHNCHHHFLWSILIMVFGCFWGIYIENFLLGRFEKNEAQSSVIVTDLWFLMIVWILNFVCKWWWVLLSLHRIYELCIIVWIDKILLTYDLCMWNYGIY